MQQKNPALEETVNTEAFSSPKSDIFTSSPHSDSTNNGNVERDANIIHVNCFFFCDISPRDSIFSNQYNFCLQNLNQVRQLVDSTLLLMKLNVTRSLTHNSTSLLTVTPRVLNDGPSRFSLPPVISKGILTGTASGIYIEEHLKYNKLQIIKILNHRIIIFLSHFK